LPKLLFIKHKDFNARTVENDLNILRSAYDVKLSEVNTSKGIGFFFSLTGQFFYLLFNTYKYKFIFIWFADYHSLLPVYFAKLFGKVSLLNMGGYDADEILTGEPHGIKAKFRKFCVQYSVKNATKLLPVSEIIKKYLSKFVDGSKSEVVYNCIDTDKFISNEISVKENLVITVGGGGEFVKEAKRKRLDFFIQLGNEFNKRYPQYDALFFAIGHNINTNTYNYLKPMIKSSNVELKSMTVSVEELVEYYRRASIYMQLSYYESFGIAQIEAMLNGCIPVSNPGGAIPEVVGDAGFLIPDFNTELYLKSIKEILDKKHENLRELAKNRVLENFTFEKRKERLLSILNSFT
jgi:glycosyltransferase involved in cell wall biosynthesis